MARKGKKRSATRAGVKLGDGWVWNWDWGGRVNFGWFSMIDGKRRYNSIRFFRESYTYRGNRNLSPSSSPSSSQKRS